MILHALDLRDPSLSDGLRGRLCWLFYNEIYKAAFPVPDEAEDPTVWLPLLVDGPHKNPITHLVLAVHDLRPPQAIDAGSLVGGIVFEYFRASRAALATYLCIKPEIRRHGVAKFLLERCLEHIRSDSGGARVPLFAEAEDPDLQSGSALRNEARRRLPILNRLGFRELPIRYRQPALGPGKHPLDGLKFLMFTAGRPATVPLSTLRSFMREFYDVLDAGEPDEAAMFGASGGPDLCALPLPADT